ncbi:MAG TPA: FUSC family protein [Terriglobales bacterium]|nr:FUSC family protein [Terriglobales bacterium]
MWRSFAQLLTKFESGKLEPAIALRNCLGVTLPLAIGMAAGMPLGGLAVASGALQVAYSDGHDPYSQRSFRMLVATLLCALAVVVGGLAGRNHILSIAAVVVWGFVSGLVVLLGSDAESLGVISLVMLIIYAAQALTVARAINAGLLALGGGFIQTLMSIALWPLFRREPERRALAMTYSDLSRVALATLSSQEAPPSTVEISQAQQALRKLGRDHGTEAQRLWSLLNQAERLRLSLLALSRLRNRLARRSAEAIDVQIIERFLRLCSDILQGIAETLLTHKTVASGAASLRDLQQVADQYRILSANSTAAFGGAVRRSVRHQLDAVAGQVRAAFQIAINRQSADDLDPSEAVPGWKIQCRDDLAKLRANLTLRSSAFRHATRLAATLWIGEVMAHAINARRTYWLPMTISLVLKPEFTVTLTRGLLRTAGTIAGLLLSTALFHFLHPSAALEVILIGVFVFLVRWTGPAHYGVFAINVSALVVLLIAFSGVAPQEVILARGLMTTLGGVTALAAYSVWPTWEGTRTPEALARMLDAYQIYFHDVIENQIGSSKTGRSELNSARMNARRERSSLEASLDRLGAEPIANAADIRVLNAMLASSHRFINAAMAIEGAHEKLGPGAANALQHFSQHIDTSLQLLSSQLRGAKLAARDLPGLRDAYRTLVAGIGAESLLAEEADRITNSLNTLSEQILSWQARESRKKPAVA